MNYLNEYTSENMCSHLQAVKVISLQVFQQPLPPYTLPGHN